MPPFAPVDRGAPPRLLLITYHFPPDTAVGALRWGKLVALAAERGWEVDVVTRTPGGRMSDPWRAPTPPAGVRVHPVPARAPLSGRIEARLRQVVRRMRGLPDPMPAGVDGPPAPMIASDSLGRREMSRFPRSLRAWARLHHAWVEWAEGDRWALDAAAVAARIIERQGTRVIITCGPPHSAHRAGETLHARTGVPWVLDLRDPWSLVQRLPEEVASPLWLAIASRREARAVRSADLIVVNTEEHLEALQTRYRRRGARMISVMNGCDDDPLPDTRRSESFVIAYTGTIYLDRDPRPLFQGIARVVRELQLKPGDLMLELMGEVASFRGMSVPALAAEAGVADFVCLRPPGSRRQAQELLAGAAMTVLLPQDSSFAIPAKTFEYLRVEAWMLALTAGDSAVARLLAGTQADVVAPADDVGIARVIRDRFLQYARGERPGRLSDDDRFSRRTQARRLFTALEQICGSRPQSHPSPCLVSEPG